MNEQQSLPQQPSDLLNALNQFERDQLAAWRVFTRQFERENPPPAAPRAWQWLPFAMLPFAVLGLSGAFLSALRTAPVFAYIAQQFYAGAGAEAPGSFSAVEGLVATLVVDGAAVAFRFAMVVYNARADAQAEISRWVNRGFYFAFASQVITNLYAVMDVATALPDTAKKVAELAIMVVAALSGIIIAFATGDILGHQWLASQARRRELEESYRAAVAERDEKRAAAWARKKARLGVREPGEDSRHDSRNSRKRPESTAPSSEDSRSSRKLYPVHWKVIDYLRIHPEAQDMPRAELARLAGIASAGMASEAVRAVRENPALLRQTPNGNGHFQESQEEE